jgi:hypothetical protein
MSEQITSLRESFLEAALAKDFTKAESAFKSVMAEKLSQALSARRVEIAQSLYSRVQGTK